MDLEVVWNWQDNDSDIGVLVLNGHNNMLETVKTKHGKYVQLEYTINNLDALNKSPITKWVHPTDHSDYAVECSFTFRLGTFGLITDEILTSILYCPTSCLFGFKPHLKIIHRRSSIGKCLFPFSWPRLTVTKMFKMRNIWRKLIG